MRKSILNVFNKPIFCILFSAALLSCNHQKPAKHDQIVAAKINQKKVGPSLVINLPTDYIVVNYEGADYESYNFLPKDTTNKKVPTGGITFGWNVSCIEQYLKRTIQRDTIPSIILEMKASWIVYKADLLYFADAFVSGKFCASISAISKHDIEGFIVVFRSLNRK